MHGFSNSEYWLPCALICLVSSMAFWWRDVISEGRAKSLELYTFPLLKIARAIPQPEIDKELVKFLVQNPIKLNTYKEKDNFFYYLAGLAFYFYKNIFLLK